jgi:uncharacterized protein (TIGR02453 family)
MNSTMNTAQILWFLEQLQQNNNKAWMDAHRADYQEARQTLLDLTEQLIGSMGKLDPHLASASLKPANCIFRINRDIRFSKDKSPYKTNMGLYLSQGGKNGTYAGYYLHLQPHNQSFIAGGLYEPTPDILKNVRQEIDYNGGDLEAIVSAKKFKDLFGSLQGEKLQRIPKGYDESNPYSEWLKLKSFLAMYPLTDAAVSQPSFMDTVMQAFQALVPFTQFFNRVMDTAVE